MALTHKRTAEASNAALDAMLALADDGYFRIYDGEQPYNAETQLSGQTLLAELRFGDPAFGPADDGVAYANAITPENAAIAAGTATWFRVFKANGNTKLWDGSVGETGCNLNLDSVDVAVGDAISITEYFVSEDLEGG